jgi:hypothetical protein
MKGILLVLVALFAFTSSVDARPRKRSPAPLHEFSGWFSEVHHQGPTTKNHRDKRADFPLPPQDTYRGKGEVIGGRPAGCPTRFCGCGASIHLFGKIIPELNLSSNWLRFPRTSAAPDTVAVRRGHVFVLKSHVQGDIWMVHDSNSGGRKTRLHHRSIQGYAIVDPRGGSKYASLTKEEAWKHF